MKQLTAAVVMIGTMLLAASAMAQPAATFGVKGGVGFSDFSFADDSQDEAFNKKRTGLLLGGSVDIPVNPMMSMVVEVLYAQKGGIVEGNDGGSDFKDAFKADYVEIPILGTFPFNTMSNVRPFVYGGIAPAFKVSAKEKIEVEGLPDEEDDIDDIKSFDLGLVFGGGVRFGPMSVEARYNLGLLNIGEGADDDHTIKNRQFAILFGYWFGH